MHEAHSRAIEVLHRNRTRYGLVISTTRPHIRARDGVIAGLAALVTGDAALIAAAGETLDTLAQFQGVHGEIPLVVDLDSGTASFGHPAGSVESLLWFCIGCARYSLVTRDRRWLQGKSAAIQKALYLAGAWQYNDRGLIYVPMGGIQGQSGYLLAEQVLYVLALRLLTAALDSASTRPAAGDEAAPDDRSLIAINYWPTAANVDHPRVYHRDAFLQCVNQGEQPYFLSNLGPHGYTVGVFDAIGNALALLEGMGDAGQVARLTQAVHDLTAKGKLGIPPIYSPAASDPGIWPLVGGLWASALAQRVSREAAAPYAGAVHALNLLAAGPFPETYQDGQGCTGEPNASISAAGSIIAEMGLEGRPLFG